MDRLRVCTFNIRYENDADGVNAWHHRRFLVVDVIRSIAPDVLCVQECQLNQFDFLRLALPDYWSIGAGRDDGRVGEMVPVFARKGRADPVDWGHFWLSEEPHMPGSRGWGAAFPRLVSWAALAVTGWAAGPVWVLNAHFDHSSGSARLESAKQIRRRINAFGGKLPAVVSGDLNAEPGSDELLPLLDGAAPTRLFDVAESVPGGTFHGFSGKPGGGRIDWILTSQHFSAQRVWIDRTEADGRFPSDHFPLVADLCVSGTV